MICFQGVDGATLGNSGSCQAFRTRQIHAPPPLFAYLELLSRCRHMYRSCMVRIQYIVYTPACNDAFYLVSTVAKCSEFFSPWTSPLRA